METCPVCHIGSLRKRRVTYTQTHKGQLTVIQGVPALVCDFCGEKWFDTEKVDGLQFLLQSERESTDMPTKRPRSFVSRGGSS
ncbi:MAG: type II toxin-antitoxin system MqsA family antitoxin [Anaerolineae bacterium]|nr:type II toxin-antitoxin system MqsA family antitoxin [Anaerolineae bacterium]